MHTPGNKLPEPKRGHAPRGFDVSFFAGNERRKHTVVEMDFEVWLVFMGPVESLPRCAGLPEHYGSVENIYSDAGDSIRSSGRDEEDRDQQEHPAHGNENNTDPGVALVRSQAAEKKAGWQEHAPAEEAGGSPGWASRFPGWLMRQGGSQDEVDHRQQCSVRVRESPHVPPCGVRHIQIPANFQSMQGLQHQAERKEKPQRPPSESQVTAGKDGVAECCWGPCGFLGARLQFPTMFMLAAHELESIREKGGEQWQSIPGDSGWGERGSAIDERWLEKGGVPGVR